MARVVVDVMLKREILDPLSLEAFRADIKLSVTRVAFDQLEGTLTAEITLIDAALFDLAARLEVQRAEVAALHQLELARLQRGGVAAAGGRRASARADPAAGGARPDLRLRRAG